MTRTNRERKVLADPEPIDNFPPVLPLFFTFAWVCLVSLLSWWHMGPTVRQEKNARDYARLATRLWRQITPTKSQAHQDENAGERGRATRPTTDAIAAP